MALLFLQSCSPTVHLKENEYLLKSYPAFERTQDQKTRIEIDSLFSRNGLNELVVEGHSSIDYDVLYYAIKSQPNRKMLIIKPYLQLYNLGVSMQKNDYKIEQIYKWFFPKSTALDTLANVLVNTAGEKPVVIDTLQLRKDADNLQSVYFSRGYFHAVVTPVIDTCRSYINRKQARVTFLITENEAWVIDTIIYQVPNAEVLKLLQAHVSEGKLNVGDLYNEDSLTVERGRIANLMRNNGYFEFKPGMVSYEIDTNQARAGNTQPKEKWITNCKQLRIFVKISENPIQYHIGNLTLQVEPSHLRFNDVELPFRPSQLTPEMRKQYNIRKTLINDSLEFSLRIYERAMNRLNINLLDMRLHIKEGDLYRLEDEKETLARLQEMGVFRFTLINYTVNDSLGTLDALIEAQLMERFQFKAGIEGFSQNDQTLRTNLPGVGGNLSFRDKSLFKGGEKLELTASGSTSFLYLQDETRWRTFFEFGTKASLFFPKLLIPVLYKRNLTSFNPTTSFSFNLNSQNRSLYKRTIFGFTWNYSINHNKENQKSRSSFSPYLINLIQSNLSQEFKDQIAAIPNDFLRSFTTLDFQPRFSSRFLYRYTWSDYNSTRAKTTSFFQPQFEFGGNTPFLIDHYAAFDSSFTDGNIRDIYYGQYYKFSVEYKRSTPIGRKKEFVWRIFSGVADPWNYSSQVPFDSRFFSGGTNSLRGWASNTLGPGTWQRSEGLDPGSAITNFLIAPGGEFSFECNVEARFNVYKFIELAIFSDAGNVWFLPSSDFDFESGKLSKTNFYQLGWDMGVGFRFDFSFFIFRVDVAKQLYAPDVQDFVVKKWSDELYGNRYQFNFGIGYPF